MTMATALLVWLYAVVNGVEMEDVVNGDLKRVKSGNVKGE